MATGTFKDNAFIKVLTGWNSYEKGQKTMFYNLNSMTFIKMKTMY